MAPLVRALSRPATAGAVALVLGTALLAGASLRGELMTIDAVPEAKTAEVRDVLLNHYVRTLTPADIGRGRDVTAMVDKLGDPYTTYLSPPRYRAVLAQTAASGVGLGLEVAPGDGVLRVLGAVDGSPAEQAGPRQRRRDPRHRRRLDAPPGLRRRARAPAGDARQPPRPARAPSGHERPDPAPRARHGLARLGHLRTTSGAAISSCA